MTGSTEEGCFHALGLLVGEESGCGWGSPGSLRSRLPLATWRRGGRPGDRIAGGRARLLGEGCWVGYGDPESHRHVVGVDTLSSRSGLAGSGSLLSGHRCCSSWSVEGGSSMTWALMLRGGAAVKIPGRRSERSEHSAPWALLRAAPTSRTIRRSSSSTDAPMGSPPGAHRRSGSALVGGLAAEPNRVASVPSVRRPLLPQRVRARSRGACSLGHKCPVLVSACFRYSLAAFLMARYTCIHGYSTGGRRGGVR